MAASGQCFMDYNCEDTVNYNYEDTLLQITSIIHEDTSVDCNYEDIVHYNDEDTGVDYNYEDVNYNSKTL